MAYRVWVRGWVAREEVFEDRHSAELFRLKLAASRPTLSPSDVAVVAERQAISDQLSVVSGQLAEKPVTED